MAEVEFQSLVDGPPTVEALLGHPVDADGAVSVSTRSDSVHREQRREADAAELLST